jgi:hypothetical protein
MKTINLRSDKFVFYLTIVIFFVSTIWISSLEANLIHALPEQTTSIPGYLGVKITEPIKGQQLNVGKNLTVLGISNYSASSNCGVLVIVDGIKPYQKATPIGQAGGNNYSRWKYTLTPPYNGTIREGTNRITAKLLCEANPENLTKFYSINVTGVNQIVPNQQHLTIKSNNTIVVPISSNNSSQNLPVPKAYTSSASVSSDSSGHQHQRSLHHHHHKGSSRTHHGYNGGYGGDNNGGYGGDNNGGYGGDNNGGYGWGYPFYGGGFFGRSYS